MIFHNTALKEQGKHLHPCPFGNRKWPGLATLRFFRLECLAPGAQCVLQFLRDRQTPPGKGVFKLLCVLFSLTSQRNMGA